MQEDFIDLIEPTPVLKSKRCKLIALFLRFFLQYTTFITPFIAWYIFDLFIAILTLVLSYIVMGIIRSKIRNSVIPEKQKEFQYNDQGIADWYVAKEICFESADL